MAIFSKSYDHFLGYALSGGGAKGFAHLGALKVLEKCGLKPDVIAGTSAGALAGVFYADGYHPDEIVELFRKKEFREFVEFTIPTTGFFKSAGLHNFLKKNLRATRFEELQIPFYVVTTDWNRASTVTFSNGDDLVDAVVASCTIPIVFHPQMIHDVPYVDGGLLKNFPVSVIRKKCKYVIGVNVSLMLPPPEKYNIRRMLERTFNLMSNSNTLLDKAYCDILIETKGIEKYSMFDLQNQLKIMEAGYHYAALTMSKNESWEIVRKCHRHYALTRKIHAQLLRIRGKNKSQNPENLNAQ
ncbi:patatin-like phospholipase family protein [uncultured Proteiniphilum sp.]|uniref:patatin-like phospholipase family protein n=1 Tax=uncultured Proteiniphilum sp. TaxID=497637 RepID=UPI002607F038|nr:patatin-like phospholipase family protein [uncultured Proteiniphilum sp.]